MIVFYPRDVGLWRDDFDFSNRSERPTKSFNTFEELEEFVKSRYDIDHEKYPLKLIEEVNHSFNTTHIVHKWTLLGWTREEI